MRGDRAFTLLDGSPANSREWNFFYGPILLAGVRIRGRGDLLVHAA
jgi:hypothetical protein